MKKILLLTFAFGFFICTLTVATGCGSDKEQLNNGSDDTENGAPVDNIASDTQEVSPEPELPDTSTTGNDQPDNPTDGDPSAENGLACSQDDIDRLKASGIDLQTDTGIIAYVDPAVDGCGWSVNIQNKDYAPENLPDDYQINKLNVKLVYETTDSCQDCAWSQIPVIRIHCISVINKHQ
jgi:hypothetical protein